MRLASFLQNRSQTIPSQGIVGDGQQVTQPQTAAVTDENPCGKQDSVRAMQSTPRHLRGYRKQMSHLVMGPRADHRKGVLDTPDRACTIVHYKAVSEGGSSQGGQHPAVIVDRGGGEMIQSLGQIRIDVADGQVGHPPREPLGQHNELLTVSGASPRLEGVSLRELSESHGDIGDCVDLVEGGQITPSAGTGKTSAILSDHKAPLAQLDRVGRSIPPSGWISRIIRGAVLASLVLLIFLHGVGTLLTLLALGQLGRAAVLFRRGLRKDSSRRTEAASFKEVYR
jgi:hypothetical protein